MVSLAMRALALEQTPSPTPTATAPTWSVDWLDIANCETEDYSTPEADINWTETSGIHEGGLQFAPSTWDAYKPAGYPDAAYNATPFQQMSVAELVLGAQGIGAWPYCGGMG